jgi:hypothetical protein
MAFERPLIMPIRIDTTQAAGISDPWTPAADFIVQGAAVDGSGATIEYQGRLDAAAPWVPIAGMRPSSEGMMVCRKLAFVRLVWSGNKAGDALKAWSFE